MYINGKLIKVVFVNYCIVKMTDNNIDLQVHQFFSEAPVTSSKM